MRDGALLRCCPGAAGAAGGLAIPEPSCSSEKPSLLLLLLLVAPNGCALPPPPPPPLTARESRKRRDAKDDRVRCGACNGCCSVTMGLFVAAPPLRRFLLLLRAMELLTALLRDVAPSPPAVLPSEPAAATASRGAAPLPLSPSSSRPIKLEGLEVGDDAVDAPLALISRWSGDALIVDCVRCVSTPTASEKPACVAAEEALVVVLVGAGERC